MSARLAFLVTAYHQPEHLARLLQVLAGEGCSAFVHVDGKVEIAPFAARLRGLPGVTLLADPMRVQWMGFSQVAATLRLLRAALAGRFDHFVLLSGSDYPLRPIAAIRDFYGRCGEQLMAFWRIADRPSWRRKIERLYPIDLVPIHGWAKGREPSFWRRYFWGRHARFSRLLPARPLPRGLVAYGGSDWWSLTRDCAEHVVAFTDRNPWFPRFFRYTLCPSDMYFQTLVLNSPWARTVRNFEAYEEWSRTTSAAVKQAERSMLPESSFNLRYIDWSDETTGERETPAVLDDRDFPALAASACLFARKFEEPRSNGLRERVDRELIRPRTL